MKKFLLGVVSGIILICACGIVSATIKTHSAIKERDRAVMAERAARAAAPQAPIR
jgi:cell division protein FtsL